jgi:hypothetical protein
MAPVRLTPEPQRANARTEMDEPKCPKSARDTAEPNLAQLLKESDEPKCTASMTERTWHEPMFIDPTTLTPLPILTKERMERVEPIWKN